MKKKSTKQKKKEKHLSIIFCYSSSKKKKNKHFQESLKSSNSLETFEKNQLPNIIIFFSQSIRRTIFYYYAIE